MIITSWPAPYSVQVIPLVLTQLKISNLPSDATTMTVERNRPRGGPCLLCRSETDEEPNFYDLYDHIRTTHVDLVEPIGELMIQVAQMKRQIQGLSSR
jgi:hypothetical protein